MAMRLDTLKGCEQATRVLFDTPPEQIGRTDIAILNLLCAFLLPGSENLNIPACISRLDDFTRYIGKTMVQNARWLDGHPNCATAEQERCYSIVRRLGSDFGAAYHPMVKAELAAGIHAPAGDSTEDFIHGVLNEDPKRRWGTCASLPVVVTAIARRLRYPVRLAVNLGHIYARWESKEEKFNIECTGLHEGRADISDEHYRTVPIPLTESDEKSGYYLRSLTPAEEFALFMKKRVWYLDTLARYEETFMWSARALQFSPDDPIFCHAAHEIAGTAIKHRLKRKYPHTKLPRPDQPQPYINIYEFLTLQERGWCATIEAHHGQGKGKLDEARSAYENACRFSPQGVNEHRDLLRFLRKYDLPPKSKHVLAPKNLGILPRVQLTCKPEERNGELMQLADQWERQDKPLNAQYALHDVYMQDPSNTEVFERMRALQKLPRLQQQQQEMNREAQPAIDKLKADYYRAMKVAPKTLGSLSGPLNITLSQKEAHHVLQSSARPMART